MAVTAPAMKEDRIVRRYFTFVRREWHRKTQLWDVVNNRSGDPLGEIAWYVPWRQYCIFADDGVVFNDSCLREIADFLTQLNQNHRAGA